MRLKTVVTLAVRLNSGRSTLGEADALTKLTDRPIAYLLFMRICSSLQSSLAGRFISIRIHYHARGATSTVT